MRRLLVERYCGQRLCTSFAAPPGQYEPITASEGTAALSYSIFETCVSRHHPSSSISKWRGFWIAILCSWPTPKSPLNTTVLEPPTHGNIARTALSGGRNHRIIYSVDNHRAFTGLAIPSRCSGRRSFGQPPVRQLSHRGRRPHRWMPSQLAGILAEITTKEKSSLLPSIRPLRRLCDMHIPARSCTKEEK